MDELTQQEADSLLALAKFRISEERHQFPDPGGKLTIEIVSEDKHESFYLDVNRSSVSLSKITYQNRARKIIILAHLYREGYADKWAFPVPADNFAGLADRIGTLRDFMKFCNIVAPPHVDSSLLS